MRGLRLGLGLVRSDKVSGAFGASISGLSADSLGSYAQPGDHASIGYSISPDRGTETVKWSNSSNPADAATYGTGASPTDFTASDDSTVYLHVTDEGETVTLSFGVRYDPGSIVSFANQFFTEGVGGTYQHPAATGTGLTWTYAQVEAITGVTYNTGTRTFTYAGSLALQVTTPFGASATDQYGRPASGSPRVAAFTIRNVPDAFTVGQWSVAAGTENDQADVTISALPAANNAAVSDIEYRVDGGAWTSSAGIVSFTIGGLTGGTKDVEIRAVNAVGNSAASDLKTVTVVGPEVSVITLSAAGPQESDGDVPLTYTIDVDDATVEVVVFDAAQPNPTAAQFGGAGAPTYVDQGTVSLTTAGSGINLNIVGTFSGSVKLAMLPTGGGTGNVAVSPAFTLDTTAPVLTNPTGAQTGGTTASWSVTSDSAGGTIYAGVRPTASAALTSAQLIAGSGGAGVDFDSDATPTADGANGGSFTGLTASTAYRVDIVQVDAFGNTSSVVTSAEFTTTTNFAVDGGNSQLIVTAQPTQPAAPTVVGGVGVLTITG